MKIVHISFIDSEGGAAIACSRHAEAMLKAGTEVKMITAEKKGRSSFVTPVHKGIYRWISDIWAMFDFKMSHKMQATGNFSVMHHGFDFSNNEYIKQADIIFLHWINNALSIKGVANILKLGKPTYWYMHDMFPITGGCHYSLSCSKYQTDCKDCPLIGNPQYKKIAEKQLNRKRIYWSKYKNLKFVAPSKWLAQCTKNSIIAKDHEVYTIPNIIDTNLFRPLQISLKNIWGLNPLKKTILFCAYNINDVYKGGKYIQELLCQLDNTKYECIIVGSIRKDDLCKTPIKIIQTGFLQDQISLSILYNSCDTFVITSVAENYPNVLLESMACGKPCVGFPTGGITDLIQHKENGYLTSGYSVAELLMGINWIFSNDAVYSQLSRNARSFVEKNNSYNNICEIYKEIDWK